MYRQIPYQIMALGRSPLSGNYEIAPRLSIWRSRSEWHRFLQAIAPTPISICAAPLIEVDFATQMVIGFTSGSRPTGGYRLQVDCIEEIENSQGMKWILHYTEHIPCCSLPQQPDTPTMFITTERRNTIIRLEKRIALYTCVDG
jgi:hypothetical protein